MKYLLSAAILFSLNLKAQQVETFHDFSHLTIIHDTLHLSDFAGKKVLVVNTASYCGYTPQLEDLVTLDSLYGGPNFAIVCFPCNDFGGQEPHDDSTIYQFYLGNYHVGFTLMSKISITAPDTAEVYKWLQLESRNGVADANVTWNFHKFCIDEAGNWVMHFPEYVNPLDTAIVNWILSPNTTGVISERSEVQVNILNPVVTNIDLDIQTPVAGRFDISLFDVQGKQVATIFTGVIHDGKKIVYDATGLHRGIYFLKIQSEKTSKVVRVGVAN